MSILVSVIAYGVYGLYKAEKEHRAKYNGPLDANESVRLHFYFEGTAGEFASATIYTNDATGAPAIQSLITFEKVRDI